LPGERWNKERKGLALGAYNRFLLAVARALRFARERLGAELRYSVDEGSSDKRVFFIEVLLPASAPLVIAVYSTTEESRPLTWARVSAKLRRLHSYIARRTPPGRDLFVAVIAATPRVRATGPAQRRARRNKVALGTVENALKALRAYLAKRLHGLVRSLRERGVKAYGKLAELLRVLYLLASRLGPVAISLRDVEAVVRA